MNKTSIFYFIFWVTCFFFTFNRLMDCMDKYLLDKSFSNMDYVDFLSPGSPYPAVTICLKEPYLVEELEKYNTTVGEYSGSSRLRNLTQLNQIPYENVTISEDNGEITYHQVILLLVHFSIFQACHTTYGRLQYLTSLFLPLFLTLWELGFQF